MLIFIQKNKHRVLTNFPGEQDNIKRSPTLSRLSYKSALKRGDFMKDQHLVHKAKKGNWQAYLDLALVLKNLLYNKALSLLGNEHDAADAVAEALVKGYDSISTLRQPQHFQTWLVRILINTCIDIQRKRQKTVFLHNLTEESILSSTPVYADSDLQTQLMNMDEKYRTVLVLRYFEDMKIDDIANLLDVPPGTVKSRLYWALKKIRLEMDRGQIYEM